jgi:hypothetical protein
MLLAADRRDEANDCIYTAMCWQQQQKLSVEAGFP